MKDLRAPSGLGRAGKALWRSLTAGIEFEPVEPAHVETACRLADRAAELEALIDADGLMIEGSKGQRVLHPAVAESRQTRAELGRTLARVAWPGAEASTAGRRLRAARKAG